MSVVDNEIAVEIAGTPVVFRSQDKGFRALLEDRYSGFVRRRTGSARFAFDVDVLAAGGPVTDRDDLEVFERDGRWHLARGDFRADWDAARGRGTIVQALSPYATDTVLRIVHSLIQAPLGGFLLHGASAIRNGKAFLFSGVSGAGKTTLSRLAPQDATLLTDEISYIRRDADGMYFACGTPFAGELARVGENAQARVEHLFFLAKGPENRIDPIPQAEALRMLLRNILFFAEDSSLVEMVFRSACEFLSSVAVSRLTFYPDERVWELIC